MKKKLFLLLLLITLCLAGFNLTPAFTGPWAADQVDFPDIYVDASAGDGGVGSEANPYNDFADINWTTGGDNSVYDYLNGSPSQDVTINAKRGEVWRESIVVGCSGTASYDITFQPYGAGNKPKILGSVAKNDVGDWTEEGAKRYSNGDDFTDNFDDNDLTGWDAIVGGVSNANERLEVTIDNGGQDYIKENADVSDVAETWQSWKVYWNSFDTWTSDYTQGGGISSTALVGAAESSGNKWRVTRYLDDASNTASLYATPALTTGQWYTVLLYWKAATGVGANDGILRVWIDGTQIHEETDLDTDTMNGGSMTCGNAYASAGTAITFYVEDAAAGSGELASNLWYAGGLTSWIGNLIFDDAGESCGDYETNKVDCTAQDDFWYDSVNNRVYLYSVGNPATFYSGNIECAQFVDTILMTNKDYITIDGLDIRYSGWVGIHGYGTDADGCSNIEIKNCTLRYIGGSSNGVTRAGNAIQFWAQGTYISVHDNTISQVFDSALTPQCSNSQADVLMRYQYWYDNIIDSVGCAFEFFNRGTATTSTDHIYVYGNTITNIGSQWSGTDSNMAFNAISLRHPCVSVSDFRIYENTIDAAISPTPADTQGCGFFLSGGPYIIYRNLIKDAGGVGIFFSHWDSSPARGQAYYNIMVNPGYEGLYCYNTAVATTLYNNVVYDPGDDGIHCIGTSNFVTAKNNIVYMADAAHYPININSGVTLDHNCYYNTAATKYYWNSTEYANFAAYQSASSQDANSVEDNPDFLDPPNDDFHPQSVSPCLNVGVDVSLMSDFEGNAPSDPPEIGAYEYMNVSDSWYVDATDGDDDNNGTESSPWQTLAKVSNCAFNPSDIIYLLRNETWNEKLTVSSSGSAGNLIVIDAYGDTTDPMPIIDAESTRDYCIDCNGKDYLDIKRVTLTGATTANILIDGTDCLFRYSKSYDGDAIGISVAGATNTLYYLKVWGNGGDGLGVNNVATIIVYNSIFYDNDIGVDVGGASASGFIMKNTVIYENATYEVQIQATVPDTPTIDYNCVYHSGGGNFMFWKATGATTWAGWKTASSQDANSINEDPKLSEPT